MSGAGDSTVTAWVKLEKAGALYELVDVEVSLGAFVSKARDKVFERMSVALKGVDRSQVKLCLSDEDRVKASPPERIDVALELDETLRAEILRLNSAWTTSDPLYILAVAEGALCWGRAWPSWSSVGAHPLPPFSGALTAGSGAGAGSG